MYIQSRMSSSKCSITTKNKTISSLTNFTLRHPQNQKSKNSDERAKKAKIRSKAKPFQFRIQDKNTTKDNNKRKEAKWYLKKTEVDCT